MSSSCDRAGFPLVHVPDRGVFIHLLPVTKLQFECFLAEPKGFDDPWYEEVLAANPRASVRGWDDEAREQLFLTGVTPEEASAFARWLGPEWSLPSLDLWRHVYRALARTAFRPGHLDVWSRPPTDGLASRLIRQLVSDVAPATLLDVSLMSGGVMEWVRDEEGFGAIGVPRPHFAQILSDPLRSPPLRPIHPDARLPYLGFRLVRTVTPAPPARKMPGATVVRPRPGG